MITARKIESIIKTGALHVLYRSDGGWYHHLEKFPGALFDLRGYVIFETKEDYDKNPSLLHRQDLNVENGISSLPEYRKFTLEEAARVVSLELTKNKVDTSAAAWQMLMVNASKAKINKETFFSPIHKKQYEVRAVTNNNITISREGGEESNFGEKFFISRINEINRSNGKVARKGFEGHVAKISAIVYLHPWLEWSDNNETILIKYTDPERRILEIVKSDQESNIDENADDFEGGSKKRLVSYYERKQNLRAKAILIHGTTCKVCQFNFKDNYGEHGEDYIEVHHLVPIHTLDKLTKVNPETDMVVLCANCHRMIHRKKYSPLSIEDLFELRNGAVKTI